MAGEQPVPDVPYVAVGWLFEDVYVAEYPGLLAVGGCDDWDRPDSEDLVQDTMVKAFINWRKLRAFQRPGAGCHMVLVNACCDHGGRDEPSNGVTRRGLRDTTWWPARQRRSAAFGGRGAGAPEPAEGGGGDVLCR